jgi:hypothetical protein
MARKIKEENMKEDDWVALGVTLFVIVMIGLICLLGLTGFFSS